MEEGLEVINDKFTAYANNFKGGDMINNRYILLSNIMNGIKTGIIKSCSPELAIAKQEIAMLIKNLFY